MSEPEILPWDRQDREPEKAYGYFVLYRDLGRTRTVAKVATEVNKSRDYLHKLATAWKWVQRAQAWDREEDRLYVEGLAEQRRDMAKRHARISSALQAKIVARLQTIDASKLSPGDIARWLEVATRVERLALGLPDSTTSHTGPDGGPIRAEVEQMSAAQRGDFFRALMAEAAARAGQGSPTSGSGDPAGDDEQEESAGAAASEE
ncbi:hypothetical protein [Micromonospora endophytica]|uniref:hypothetical protein n=1 Tax=Micromonospora endophytica TaxID=515350 RepID=UPI000E687BCD|nr:hypothetical protein [Micromonospora endophytica]RIW43226.1 hypothetical protein D3H59_20855 [Micromonospora endophytica]BCJ61548.1 hypothetical protein Jiend_49700 [Micromonospora endophytica]